MLGLDVGLWVQFQCPPWSKIQAGWTRYQKSEFREYTWYLFFYQSSSFLLNKKINYRKTNSEKDIIEYDFSRINEYILIRI